MVYIPKDTLQRAKKQGYAVLVDGDVAYKIQGEKKKGPFTIIAEVGERVVGLIQNATGGDHDIIKVEPGYRGGGIGETLFALKTLLDGKRKNEWSPKYSSIGFLIKHGYYPVAIINTDLGTLIPLKKEDIQQLCLKIKEAKSASFAQDDAGNFYYLKLIPWKAFFLSRKI